MRIFWGIGITAIVILAISVALAFSGVYNIAASHRQLAIVEWFLSKTMESSVKFHSRKITSPTLDNRSIQSKGYEHYSQMCVDCHGGPGLKKEAFSKGLNPDPPDLSKTAPEWTDAQLFWIVTHGVQMTAMPAFSITMDDKKVWNVVSFVRILPKVTPEDITSFGAEK
jgi:mono/diheme cytochrome c family protein